MITIDEKFESRIITTGLNPSVELNYDIKGTNLSDEARLAAEAGSPAFYDIYDNGAVVLPRESVTIQPVGDNLWEAKVRYALFAQTNDATFTFDTGGGTQHITNSLGTVASYPNSFPPDPDFKGAINVTKDGVEGTDIAVPTYQWSETHYLPDAAVTAAYKAALFWLTATVNDATFQGFNAGEVLFLGATGTKRGQFGDWEITYRFAASPNVTGLTIGGITGIAKKGWEYLWVRYEEKEDTVAKALVRVPKAVYIEQVYRIGDFSQLGI